jgi:hypothetical protein
MQFLVGRRENGWLTGAHAAVNQQGTRRENTGRTPDRSATATHHPATRQANAIPLRSYWENRKQPVGD